MMPFYCSNLWIWNIFIFFCDSIACVRACVCVCVCVCVYASQTSKIRHAIFLAKIVSRGYHVYCSNSWKTLVIYQPVLKGIWSILLQNSHHLARLGRCGHSWPYSPQNIAVCLLLFAGRWFCHNYCCQYTVLNVTSTRKWVGAINPNDIKSHF